MDAEKWTWGERIEPFDRKFTIVGFLPTRNEHIYIEGAQLRSLPGLANEGGTALSAYIALSSSRPFCDGEKTDSITRLRIPLGSLWPWLKYPMPKMHEKDMHIEIDYQKENSKTFILKDSSITIDVETSIRHDFEKRTVVVEQFGWLDLKFDEPVSLECAKDVFLHLEDFLVLLTDQECALDWPLVQTSNDNDTGTLFCFRRRPIKSEVSAFEFWVVLPQIIDNFGEIVGKWLEMRPKYGAALHLYLGIRRGASVYVEHKFANFMWGLEALHRLLKPEKLRENQYRKESLDEILKIIDRAQNSKERAKLRRALSGMEDRSLSVKLFELLSMLPLNFLDDTLRNFTDACANRRNDISHYGGPRNPIDYDDFIQELISLTYALDHLYHAIILLQLGVSKEVLHGIFYKNMKSMGIRTQLRWAGLKLPEPQPPSQPPMLPRPPLATND